MTYDSPNRQIYFEDLGLIPYKDAWDVQEVHLKELVNRKILLANASPITGGIGQATHQPTQNYLFFCEHPHVYTLGKSGKKEHLLLNDDFMKSIEAEYYESNRGGDITYHGPGQLVAYPVLDLENFFTDIHRYMRFLEESVIQTCAAFGLEAGRVQGLTGVWIAPESAHPRKICAMGVKTSRWVTMHGLALNVNTDLAYFGHIVPCGISDKAVTSLNKELGRDIDLNEVKTTLKKKFCEVFEAELLQIPKIVPQT